MDTISKKPRSKTRKTISTLAKIYLGLRGEPIPATAKQKQSPSHNRPVFLKILFFLLKLPFFVLVAILSTKHKKEPDPINDLYMQDPSLFNSTPPCKRPPHER